MCLLRQSIGTKLCSRYEYKYITYKYVCFYIWCFTIDREQFTIDRQLFEINRYLFQTERLLLVFTLSPAIQTDWELSKGNRILISLLRAFSLNFNIRFSEDMFFKSVWFNIILKIAFGNNAYLIQLI